MEVRAATPVELPALHMLVERAYRGEASRAGWTHEADLVGGQRTDIDMLGAIITAPRSCVLVAVEGAAIIGCVHVADLGNAVAYLGLLSVEPERQATGLGKVLITAAEDKARSRWESHTIEMTVIARRAELIAYYHRRGYFATGETRPFPRHDPRHGMPLADDLDFVVLAKRLV